MERSYPTLEDLFLQQAEKERDQISLRLKSSVSKTWLRKRLSAKKIRGQELASIVEAYRATGDASRIPKSVQRHLKKKDQSGSR